MTRYIFNDGEALYGDTSGQYLYQRKARLDVGLEMAPASPARRAAMWQAASALSFETPADCARLLAWSVLAPFCGALSVRPAVFLTGQSGSGKSTVLQYVVKRMARGLYVTNVTEAGIRQEMQLDCLPVIIEEAEGAGDEHHRNMNNIFALMRQSFSDDSPRILKGTTQGKSISYVARSMFLYAAIQPGYEREADANRIAVVEMRKPENNWAAIRAELSTAWTEESCAAVRAFVWANLAAIIREADAFSEAIHELTGMDTRYSLLEGILWSAHWRVWKDRFPDADALSGWLGTVYDTKPVERGADDSQAMLDRIFAEVVKVFDAPSKAYPLEYMLSALSTGREKASEDGDPPEMLSPDNRERYRRTVSQWGLYIDSKGRLCVALHNPYLVRMLASPQYAKVMARHPECLEKDKGVTPSGEKTRRCMVFAPSVLEGDPPI